MNWIDLSAAIGSVATALGVFAAVLQIRESKRQAVTAFEDSMSSQYRDLVQRIPVEALLGENLEEPVYRENLNEFYHYIDLTNEQIFLRARDRITPETWQNWCDGIRTILAKPAFARAWQEVSQRSPGSFEELRRLIDSGYTEDPVKWRKLR
ncbi:MAG: hypothetical protein ACJ76J_01120 [Thermoanaerobaculia bacterium]